MHTGHVEDQELITAAKTQQFEGNERSRLISLSDFF